jgi:hypothetical protein
MGFDPVRSVRVGQLGMTLDEPFERLLPVLVSEPARARSASRVNTGTFWVLHSDLDSAQRAAARLEGWPAPDLTRLRDLTVAATLTCDGV